MKQHINYKQQIAKIMREFDFKRVHRAMTAMQWEWTGDGVPSLKRIKQCAQELLLKCGKTHDHSVGTGGFRASCRNKHLSLIFYIAEATGWDEP